MHISFGIIYIDFDIMYICVVIYVHIYIYISILSNEMYMLSTDVYRRGGGLGSRPKKMYGERLGDGVEYHLMKPTPRR